MEAGKLSTGWMNPPDEEEQRELIAFYEKRGLLPESRSEVIGMPYRAPVNQTLEAEAATAALFGNQPPRTIPYTRDYYYGDIQRQLFPDFGY